MKQTVLSCRELQNWTLTFSFYEDSDLSLDVSASCDPVPADARPLRPDAGAQPAQVLWHAGDGPDTTLRVSSPEALPGLLFQVSPQRDPGPTHLDSAHRLTHFPPISASSARYKVLLREETPPADAKDSCSQLLHLYDPNGTEWQLGKTKVRPVSNF